MVTNPKSPLPQFQRRVEFKLGSSQLSQTRAAIATLLANDDDLLLAAYGYAHAGAINEMHLGQWLKQRPNKRRLILLVGVHDDDMKAKPAYESIRRNFNDLFSHWSNNQVPLQNVLVYAVEHWHSKVIASMESLGSLPQQNFSGGLPSQFEQAFSYDPNDSVVGQVREAIIGSSNATYRALGKFALPAPPIRNFEMDVHILRNSTLELGDLSSKIHTILSTAIECVNTPNSHSNICTSLLRKLIPVPGGPAVVYESTTYPLQGI